MDGVFLKLFQAKGETEILSHQNISYNDLTLVSLLKVWFVISTLEYNLQFYNMKCIGKNS